MSRDELKAMVEVQSKNVEQLTVIANHLATIVDRENKIYERLYNGLSKEITSSIVTSVEKVQELVTETKESQSHQCASARENMSEVLDDKLKNCDMAKDIGYTKWFVGIVGLIIVVVTVVLNGIDRRNEGYTLMNQFKNELSHVTSDQSADLKAHLAISGEQVDSNGRTITKA